MARDTLATETAYRGLAWSATPPANHCDLRPPSPMAAILPLATVASLAFPSSISTTSSSSALPGVALALLHCESFTRRVLNRFLVPRNRDRHLRAR